jgi:hypothetical protein
MMMMDVVIIITIYQATRAAVEMSNKCPSESRETYKKCLKHVSKQCQLITKTMVTSMEYQRHDVTSVTEVINILLMLHRLTRGISDIPP